MGQARVTWADLQAPTNPHQGVLATYLRKGYLGRVAIGTNQGTSRQPKEKTTLPQRSATNCMRARVRSHSRNLERVKSIVHHALTDGTSSHLQLARYRDATARTLLQEHQIKEWSRSGQGLVGGRLQRERRGQGGEWKTKEEQKMKHHLPFFPLSIAPMFAAVITPQ